MPSIDEHVGSNYQPPSNTQFSVFLPNRVGRMLDLSAIFDSNLLTLASLSVVDATDHAVVRVVTSNADLCRRLLLREGLHFSEAEVLVVEIGPGRTLTELCRCLLTIEVNLQYAYPLLIQPRGLPVVVIHTDDIVISGQILRRKMFALLGENDLGDNSSRNTPGEAI